MKACVHAIFSVADSEAPMFFSSRRSSASTILHAPCIMVGDGCPVLRLVVLNDRTHHVG